jgi:hypothetical protein
MRLYATSRAITLLTHDIAFLRPPIRPMLSPCHTGLWKRRNKMRTQFLLIGTFLILDWAAMPCFASVPSCSGLNIAQLTAGGANNATGCVTQDLLFSQWTATETANANDLDVVSFSDGTLPGGPVDLKFSFSAGQVFPGVDPQITFSYTVTVLDPNTTINAAGEKLNGLRFNDAGGGTGTAFSSAEWCVNGNCSDAHSRSSSLSIPTESSPTSYEVGFSPNITSAFVATTLSFNGGNHGAALTSMDMTFTQFTTTPEPARCCW